MYQFSRTFFNLMLEGIVWKANLRYNITNQIQSIVYADYITIMSNGKATSIKVIQILDREDRELGLEINENKTKYMRQSRVNILLIPQLSGNDSWKNGKIKSGRNNTKGKSNLQNEQILIKNEQIDKNECIHTYI